MTMMSSLIAFLAQLNPYLVVAVLGLAYLHRACTYWRWPLIVDPLLLALYAWRPSLGMLAFVLALYAVRHVSALAREVAMIFNLDAYEGWTPRVIVFLLPGLEAYSTTPAKPPLGAAPATNATTVLDVADLPPMLVAEWLAWANDDETAPHLGVIGPTRSGKTTWVLATLSRRKGTLVITTPKAKDTDPWGGLRAVRLRIDLEARAVNWRPIAHAIAGVHFEMLRRNAENTIAQENWLTLVIDEFASTIAAAPEVRQYVLDLWLMGASSKIRVVVLAPEVNVKAWGIEGRGDVRENLLFARVAPDRTVQMGRLDGQGRLQSPRRLDTRALLQLAAHAQLSFRAWSGLSERADWRGDDTASAPASPPVRQTQTHGRRPMASDAEIDDLLTRGYKRREAEAALRQQGKGLDHNRWAARNVARQHRSNAPAAAGVSAADGDGQ
jgi:hypothetical protein